MPNESRRTQLFRTDFCQKVLTEEHFGHIGSLFASHYKGAVADFSDFTRLLTFLSRLRVVVRLDRVPQTVKQELKKWPEKMQAARVG